MLVDQVMQERSLDLFYDTAPNPFEAALFDGDPTTAGGGVDLTKELAGSGYARATVDVPDWNPATGGAKTTGPIQFPDSGMFEPGDDGSWRTASWVGLYDPVVGAWADIVPLSEDLDVTGPAPGPAVYISIYYSED